MAERGDDHVPDETTILKFRDLLENLDLTEEIFKEVNAYLIDNRIEVRPLPTHSAIRGGVEAFWMQTGGFT